MEIPVISGLSQIKNNYDAFIVDIWGVIFEGAKLYDGVLSTLTELKRENKKIVFLTNSSRRSSIVADNIAKLGVTRDLYHGLLSSGEIIHYELKEKQNHFYKSLGKRFFHLGPQRKTGITDGLDLTEVKDVTNADFVLETGPIYENGDLENYAPFLRSCINRNLNMVCANPDRITLKDGHLTIGSGSIANLYEKMGGFVSYRGKPSNNVFEYCIEGLEGIDKSRIAVIGDSFDTDIAGANKVGLDSILVMGGIHSREIKGTSSDTSLEEKIYDLSRIYGFFPKMAISSFNW
jgi:HAD superfamily hydrolase (TIGR01459 family)